jgi:hypothetical protein
VGTTPSMTPPVHATIGTGVYPRRHGIIDFVMGKGDELVGSTGSGPQSLMVPTLADLYDRDRGNRPLIGLVAWEPTLGMIGHGSFLEGGDQDLVLATKQGEWGLSPENRRHFRFEGYVETIGGLHQEAARQDLEDGRLDGQWLGQSLATALDIEYTPAYSRYQTQVLAEVIRRDGFGHDDVSDLLFTNYKQIDLVGHRWSMNSPQMEAVLRSSDRALGQLVRILDEEVGRGRWVLALTADHGLTPHRSRTGAVFMVPRVLGEDIRAVFDDQDERKVLETTRPTQMWIDIEELKSNGFTLADVARYISRYTRGQYEDDPGSLSESERRERLFSLAIPGRMLERLPCLPRSGGGAGGGKG